MSEYLILICELAVAFAGFTAIVTAVQSGPDKPIRFLTAFRLRQMLELSLLTIAGGLLPHLIGQFGIADATVWRVAGGVMAGVGIVVVRVQTLRGFQAQMRRETGYSLALARFLLLLGLAVVLSFILSATAVIMPESGYVLGLTILLAVAGIQFLRTCTSILRLPTDQT